MWSKSIPEELLTLEAVLPGQFSDMWQRSSARTPARILASAVLARAVADLETFHAGVGDEDCRIFRDAYEWVTSDERGWPFSFTNVCELLGFSPAGVREAVVRRYAPPEGAAADRSAPVAVIAAA